VLRAVPDRRFPHRREVLTGSGVREQPISTRGSIPMRGVAHIEGDPAGQGRHRRGGRWITEPAYQLSKAGWIEKGWPIKGQRTAKIAASADIRDEREPRRHARVVEVRRDGDPEKGAGRACSAAPPCRAISGAILLPWWIGTAPAQPAPAAPGLSGVSEHSDSFAAPPRELKRTEDRLRVVERLMPGAGIPPWPPWKGYFFLEIFPERIQAANDAAEAPGPCLQVHLELTERAQAEAVLRWLVCGGSPAWSRTACRKEAATGPRNGSGLRHLLDDPPVAARREWWKLRSLKKRFATPRAPAWSVVVMPLVAQRAAAIRPNPRTGSASRPLMALPP